MQRENRGGHIQGRLLCSGEQPREDGDETNERKLDLFDRKVRFRKQLTSLFVETLRP